MKKGDRVKVVKLKDGWEDAFTKGDPVLKLYRKSVGKIGTIICIEDGAGFVDKNDEIELEIDGERDLFFYQCELELVEEAMRLVSVTVDDNSKMVRAIYADYDRRITIEIPLTSGVCNAWLELHDWIRSFLKDKFMQRSFDDVDDLYDEEDVEES